tara:strand:- start:647 stop:1756 length:1110 start_codon:yes stop_codon:yes gene_type:complete
MASVVVEEAVKLTKATAENVGVLSKDAAVNAGTLVGAAGEATAAQFSAMNTLNRSMEGKQGGGYRVIKRRYSHKLKPRKRRYNSKKSKKKKYNSKKSKKRRYTKRRYTKRRYTKRRYTKRKTMKRRYTKKHKKRLIKKGGVLDRVENAFTRGIKKVVDGSVSISKKVLHTMGEGEQEMARKFGEAIHVGAKGASQGILKATELFSGVTVYTIEGVEGTTNTTFMIAGEGAQVASGIGEFFKKETINTLSGLVDSTEYTLITLKKQSEGVGDLLSNTLQNFTDSIKESSRQGEKISETTLNTAGVVMKDSVKALTLPGTLALYPLTGVEEIGGGVKNVLLCASDASVIGVTYAEETAVKPINAVVKPNKQ